MQLKAASRQSRGGTPALDSSHAEWVSQAAFRAYRMAKHTGRQTVRKYESMLGICMAKALKQEHCAGMGTLTTVRMAM